MNLPYHRISHPNKNIILMYHGVCDTPNPYNKRHCYLHDFEKQIAYLKKSANVISLKDFFAQKFDPLKSNVAITFDDGYLNNFNLALHILEKYQVPASMYITGLANDEHPFIWADFLQIIAHSLDKNFVLEDEEFTIQNKQIVRVHDGKQMLHIIKHEKPEYAYKQKLYASLHHEFASIKENTRMFWKLMNNLEIQQLSKSKYITVGSHGLLHNNLGNISFENAKAEITQSKSYLENLIQREVNEIAFPDGSYSEEVMKCCNEIGIQFQLAAEYFSVPDDAKHPHLRKRNGIYQIGTWSNQLVFN
jgi:peptidoglycan/xylan/chitin deacetylase (PgdA/CDA1 family)